MAAGTLTPPCLATQKANICDSRGKKKQHLALQCLGRGAFFATRVYDILVISHSDTLITNLDLMLLSFLFCDKCKQ